METLHDPKRAENPLEKANFLSKWLFWYVNPLLIHGYKNILDKTSIFKVHRNSSAAFLNTKIESYWRTDQQKYGKPNLMRVIFKMGFRKLAVAGFCFIIEDTCRISQALFLKRLLDSLLSDPVDSMKYVYWASCLVAVLFTQVAVHSLSLLTSETVGVNSRSACLTLLYKKALKLSNAKLSSITTGHVITMFSSDAQKIQEGFKLVNYIWLGPLIMVAAIFLLWNEVGTICLIGVGVLLISLPIQASVGRFYAKMRLKTVLKTDKRVNIMNEIISSMQVTKMYAWEESFSNLVNKARKLESNAVMKTSLVRALNISMHSGTIYIILFAVFSMYYFYGDGITLSVVFFVMSIFYSIRLPVLVLFPVAVQVAMECYVSCNRIQEFLLKDEIAAIDADNSQKKENPKYEPMVKFENVVASWDEKNDYLDKENYKPRELQPLLNKVSFLANHKKSLIMVIGPVGSGKSSLLMAAMKELKILSGDMVVNGSIAYVSQESWVFGGTVRQNILFGKDYKKAAYNEVIKACDLQKDVDSFEKGDLTLVGERGVSLSGGQKARINLARAAYHNADIYLLDDPLSAVDAKVGKYLFEKCIKGLLKNKIVILVTHQVQFLKHADDIVCLQKNEKTLHGSLEDLTHCGIDVAAILQPDNTDKQSESCPATDKDNDMLGGDNLLIPRRHSGISTHFSNDTHEDQSTDFKSSLESVERPPLDDREESVAKGSVSFKLYIKYFYSGVGWLSFMFMIFTMLLGQTFTTFTDFWLGKWALSESQANQTVTSDLVYKDDPDINIYVFAGLVLFTAFSNIFRAMYFFATLVRCSKKLHNNMFNSMLKAPMYFFDTNPVGQILNRFSGDVHLLDNELPWIFYDYTMYAILIMSTVILNCVNVPYLVPVAVVLFILFVVLRNFYIRTSRQIKRLEAISRSPLYTHVSATLNGITTIRAFNMEDKILSEFNACLDYQVGAYLTYLYGTRWFGFRLDFTAFIFQLFSIFAPIITVQFNDIDKSLLAVSLTYVLMISGSFQWCIRQSAEVDNLMTSAERVFEYAQIKPEADDGCNYGLEPTWPNSGSITADSASFSYHSSLKNALNKLNFTIRSKEKIGIVGRTGAGKSSLISMLLRLGEMNGTVKIDGYDISNLKLKKLRKSISVIPQDPVLFSGTLRKNLDPFVQYKDGDIWEALEEVQLKETVMKLPNKLLAEITEAGSNLSVGERQLMCLARALLRNNRILLIDEATANVDLKTDSIIQRTIRKKFKDCTVLTIAHRLNTIMDSDRVMVIDHGEIVEFDEPCDLLQIPSGYFRKLVNQTGEDEANFLELLAKETKDLRKSDSVKQNGH